MITCPNCQLSSSFPMFRCMRCANHLLEGADADGTQVTLRFAGGELLRLAVYRNREPVHVEEIAIEGSVVQLTLKGDARRHDYRASSLFEVIRKGAQLWDLG